MKTLTLIGLLSILALPAKAFLFPTNPPPAVQLYWNAVVWGGITNYTAYWGVGSLQYTNKMAVGNVLSTPISNLVRGVTYFFSVTCTASNLESSFSNEVTYTPPNPPPPPTLSGMVILQVEYKNSLEDFMWADAPMNWILSPDETNRFYRLEMASIAPPAPMPRLRVIVMPPLPR